MQDLEAAGERLVASLAPLEAHLQHRTFVAGQELSLADVALTVDLRTAFEKVHSLSSPMGPHSAMPCACSKSGNACFCGCAHSLDTLKITEPNM